jgi:hypothetical protein
VPTLPSSPTQSVALADWLELVALTADDGNASAGDLGAALTAAGFYDSTIDALEVKLLAVFSELERRVKAGADAYPFAVLPDGVIKARDDAWQACSSYLFCLALSMFGNEPVGGVFPARAFEVLCRYVAATFVNGEAVRFGSPRHTAELHSEMPRAIAAICRLMREGESKDRKSRSKKDDGLDIVAWRDFPDLRAGKLLAFAACASGDDWTLKLRDLEPREWCAAWLKDQPESPILKLFFMPHRVESDLDWSDRTRKAGLIFDRCRIAVTIPKLPDVAPHGDVLGWAQGQIAGWQ